MKRIHCILLTIALAPALAPAQRPPRPAPAPRTPGTDVFNVNTNPPAGDPCRTERGTCFCPRTMELKLQAEQRDHFRKLSSLEQTIANYQIAQKTRAEAEPSRVFPGLTSGESLCFPKSLPP